MQKCVLRMIVAVLATGFVSAQAPNKMAIEKAILANEMAINQAVAKGDAAAFKKLVAADAWSVDVMGVTPVSEFEKMLPQLKIEPGWKIVDSKILWINDTAAVHVYRWNGKATMQGMTMGDAYASTTWVNRGGNWVAAFHQESPVAPPMKK